MAFHFRSVKLYEILKNIMITADGPPSKFNVTRNNPFEGARRAINRKNFKPNEHISVRFADDFGQSEGAVDSGGPKRELFRLLLKEMQNTPAFTGDDDAKLFSLNAEGSIFFKIFQHLVLVFIFHFRIKSIYLLFNTLKYGSPILWVDK